MELTIRQHSWFDFGNTDSKEHAHGDACKCGTMFTIRIKLGNITLSECELQKLDPSRHTSQERPYRTGKLSELADTPANERIALCVSDHQPLKPSVAARIATQSSVQQTPNARHAEQRSPRQRIHISHPELALLERRKCQAPQKNSRASPRFRNRLCARC